MVSGLVEMGMDLRVTFTKHHRISRGGKVKKCVELFQAMHSWAFNKVNLMQSPFLLAVRMYWGWQFLQAGYGKLGNLPKVIDFFTSLNIPHPAFNAHLVAYTEFIGGALLFAGLASRIVAVPLVINMTMAYITADREALASIFSDPGKFYAADPYTFWFAAILVLIFGPGSFSLDRVISYVMNRRKTSETVLVPDKVKA